jgi:tRNA-2-methylthio-N6-dimethylallyladenosine synthase
MKRNYTVKEYKNLVKKIREKIPGIRISTDVIVGFPGETKKQFQNTVKLFREIKFDYAYIAKYSPRPGTAAFQLKDDVSSAEKKQREKILREIINKK